MNTEHLGNDTDSGKPKYWKRNVVSTPFCLPRFTSIVDRYTDMEVPSKSDVSAFAIIYSL
jgi:hypothetical protein